MREILFRGKKVTDGEWVFGCYSIFSNMPAISEPSSGGLSKGYRVISETLGQYTGLTDKNGTKIFEGDIVSQGIDNFIVKWNNEQSKFDISIGKCGFCVAGFNEPTMKFYQVIGNTYDNPELLKGE